MLTHPRLVHAILALRPGLNPRVDFIVQDDGKGPYLAKWNAPVAEPTQQDVDAVSPADLDLAQANKHVNPNTSKDDRLKALLAPSGLTVADLKAAVAAPVTAIDIKPQ